MEISYFSTKQDLEEDTLLKAVKEAIPKKKIRTFSDIEKLKDDLELRVGSKTVVVLVALTEEALLDIYCIHYIFHSVSTILILPDNDECFQALAHGMKPNFLFYADSREEDIISVIAEMMGETRKMTTINERRVQKAAGNFTTTTPHYLEDRVSNL
jgi:predicted small metal-binding protein